MFAEKCFEFLRCKIQFKHIMHILCKNRMHIVVPCTVTKRLGLPRLVHLYNQKRLKFCSLLSFSKIIFRNISLKSMWPSEAKVKFYCNFRDSILPSHGTNLANLCSTHDNGTLGYPTMEACVSACSEGVIPFGAFETEADLAAIVEIYETRRSFVLHLGHVKKSKWFGDEYWYDKRKEKRWGWYGDEYDEYRLERRFLGLERRRSLGLSEYLEQELPNFKCRKYSSTRLTRGVLEFWPNDATPKEKEKLCKDVTIDVQHDRTHSQYVQLEGGFAIRRLSSWPRLRKWWQYLNSNADIQSLVFSHLPPEWKEMIRRNRGLEDPVGRC